MRFVCDIDNVIVDWQSTWADLYTLWYDVEVDPAVLDTWDACLEGTHFTSMPEFFSWFLRAGGNERTNQNLIPGALGALDVIGGMADLVLCTARPPHGEVAAQNLAATLPWKPPVFFLNGTSKHLVPGGSLWLDDSPEVLTSLVENGKRAIRFDRPWNRDLPAKVEKQLYVAHTWIDVVEIVRKETA